MKTTATQTHTFLYDGWNLIREEIEAATPTSRSYVWGLDLSGTLQGAGGVGGLLAMLTSDSGLLTPVYDANGNVTDLVDTNGVIVAHYEYDGFGNAIARSGAQADANPFRFSTKYSDDETGLVYYGYRFYSPSLGRWLTKDPIEERGGYNLYAFPFNDPLNGVDPLGLKYNETITYSYSPLEGRIHEGSGAGGESTFGLSLKSSCMKCAEGRGCYKIKLDEFLVAANTILYVNYWSNQKGMRVLRGLPLANIRHTWNHEKSMRDMVKSWHDGNEAQIRADLDTKCEFRSSVVCDRDRRVRESRWRGQWAHLLNQVQIWDLRNRGQGPIVTDPEDPWSSGDFSNGSPPGDGE